MTHPILDLLKQFPAVALLGPRQVGKTTLAQSIGNAYGAVYLDLENPNDREKLSEPALYLEAHQDKLVIIDEIQHLPALFYTLRGLIDKARLQGKKSGQFLLLGSASLELLKQSGETLAGRVAYVELSPIDVTEVKPESSEKVWIRGGFPDSLLAEDERQSFIWRQNFIKTYLERDIPQLGPRIPAATLRRFWVMLAHCQGGLLNAASLARGLALDGKTVAHYLDLLVDLLLVRRLIPYQLNVSKRMVKSPKVYVRDSGILHALLGISGREILFGHSVVGTSWEGFVVETLINLAPEGTIPGFYRTTGGAEIDLVLEFPGGDIWAIEIKRNLAPKPGKGFYSAREDLKPSRSFVVYPGSERFFVADGVEAIPLLALAKELQN